MQTHKTWVLAHVFLCKRMAKPPFCIMSNRVRITIERSIL